MHLALVGSTGKLVTENDTDFFLFNVLGVRLFFLHPIIIALAAAPLLPFSLACGVSGKEFCFFCMPLLVLVEVSMLTDASSVDHQVKDSSSCAHASALLVCCEIEQCTGMLLQ